MKNIRILAILNLVFFLIAFLISSASQFKIFSTQNIGEISDQYPAVFTPAGFTFSIWGMIYLSLTAFCIYHLVKSYQFENDHQANTDTSLMGYLFIMNNMGASLWVLAWLFHYPGISVILMILQLLTLLAINIRLHIYNPHRTWTHKILTQMPLSIYFGWICVATIANISAWLVSVNWSGMGISDTYWAVILIGLATLVTLFIVFVRRNLFFAAVVVWALHGILYKNQHSALSDTQQVIQACYAAISLIVLSGIIQAINNIRLSRIEANTPYAT